MLRWLASVLLLASLALPVAACPLCKEAIATTDPEEEVNHLPRAYNNSIYLMVAVPYLSLGIVGFAIYRGVKRNAEHLAAIRNDNDV